MMSTLCHPATMPRGFCRCDRRRHHGGGNGFRSEPAHPVWFPRARRRTACVRPGFWVHRVDDVRSRSAPCGDRRRRWQRSRRSHGSGHGRVPALQARRAGQLRRRVSASLSRWRDRRAARDRVEPCGRIPERRGAHVRRGPHGACLPRRPRGSGRFGCFCWRCGSAGAHRWRTVRSESRGTCRSRRREQPLIRSRIMAIPSRDVRAWPSLHARGEPVEPRAPVWRLVLRQAQDERCTAPRS